MPFFIYGFRQPVIPKRLVKDGCQDRANSQAYCQAGNQTGEIGGFVKAKVWQHEPGGGVESVYREGKQA